MTDRTKEAGSLFDALPKNVIALTDEAHRSVDAGNPDYLPSVFCHVGLPRSRHDGQTFERNSGNVSLQIEAGKTFDGQGWQPQFIPYGIIPRLALIHITSEAVRTQSPQIDVGNSVYSFLETLGVGNTKATRTRARKQMTALAACHMRLGRLEVRDGKQYAQTVDAKPFQQFEAWVSDTGSQAALWPTSVELSEPFFQAIMQTAVPLRHDALAALTSSALALDIYSWLAHRLWRVRRGGATISWAALSAQFGQEYKNRKYFKREFAKQLHNVMAAYPEARVAVVTGGIRLESSPPPIPRTTVRKLAKPKP